MKISLIAAVGENNEIGKDNDLLWHLPADMKYFTNQTSGHHVLMGRKNYESIPSRYRPLPGRPNIVITRNKDYKAPGAHVFSTIGEGIKFAAANKEDELFIIGGAEIFSQTMNVANIMYITEVHGKFEADTYFPVINHHQWDLILREDRPADEKNPYDLSFCTYIKRWGL